MQDNSFFLSVVIPVYNLEGYLERCVDSVLAAAIDDMQIILINDGSKDNSPAICDRYAKEHENIQVIHQENSGISVTRNNGIAAAKGEYTFFLDSDDAVEPGIFRAFRDNIKARNDRPDLMFIDCVFVHDETGVETPFRFPVSPDKLHNVTGEQALKLLLSATPNFDWYCWRYFYRTAYLVGSGVRFPEGVTYEDVPFTSQIITLAKQIDYMPVVGLRYTSFRKGSIVNSMSLKKVQDKLFVSDGSCRFDMEHVQDPELLEMLLSNHAELFVGSFRNYCEAVSAAYPYLKEYRWLARYSKTRYGKFIYRATTLLGFRLGALISKAMLNLLYRNR